MSESNGRSTPLLIATGQSGPLKSCGVATATGLAAAVSAPLLLAYGYGIVAVGLFAVGALTLLGSVWLTWLITFTECPECGFSVEPHSGEQAESNA